MKTIGLLLRQARLRQKISLAQIAAELKVTQAVVQALELGDYSKLPQLTVVKGFIRNYALAVGVDPDKAMAVFRRDHVAQEERKIIPQGLTKPLDRSTHPSGKNLVMMITLGVIFIGFAAYFVWQLNSFFAPPELSVIQPQPGITVKGPNVDVKGWVSADSKVTVNGKLAQIYPNGEFQVEIALLPGDNSLTIRAENRRGKSSEQVFHVNVVDK